MKKVFIDCGAHDGCSVQMFVDNYSDYKDYEIYSFECNEKRFKQLIEKSQNLNLSNFIPMKKAVWVNNGKKIFDGWQFKNTLKINDDKGVECIDLSEFIINNFSKEDYIILKMDIEGSEVDVICHSNKLKKVNNCVTKHYW